MGTEECVDNAMDLVKNGNKSTVSWLDRRDNLVNEELQVNRRRDLLSHSYM
jgi:hypothetical protein